MTEEQITEQWMNEIEQNEKLEADFKAEVLKRLLAMEARLSQLETQ